MGLGSWVSEIHRSDVCHANINLNFERAYTRLNFSKKVEVSENNKMKECCVPSYPLGQGGILEYI